MGHAPLIVRAVKRANFSADQLVPETTREGRGEGIQAFVPAPRPYSRFIQSGLSLLFVQCAGLTIYIAAPSVKALNPQILIFIFPPSVADCRGARPGPSSPEQF